MKAKIIFVLLILMFMISGCVHTPEHTAMQGCVTGCMAGMQWNGTEFLKMNLTEDDVFKIQKCQQFCDLYFDSEMSQVSLLPRGDDS